jgi:hypothetical protein
MQISLSQGMGMSFTEMLLSVEHPSTSQVKKRLTKSITKRKKDAPIHRNKTNTLMFISLFLLKKCRYTLKKNSIQR